MPEEETREGQEGEEEKELTRREARIQELTRRNTELERLVNMDKRIDAVAGAAQQAANAANLAAQNMNKSAEDEDKWTPFLKPKMGKIIEEALTPYKQAIITLADQNDRLQTMQKYPEYTDPEIQQEVENIVLQRQQQTGQREPRENVILYLRGQNPDKFAGKGKKPAAGEESVNRQEEQSQVHVESKITSTPPNRALKGKTLELNTATAADIEKWATETGWGNESI